MSAYTSAEMQSVYSPNPADWAKRERERERERRESVCVCVCMCMRVFVVSSHAIMFT